MNLPEVQTISFHGRELLTVERDGELYVAMKPIVEGMGLAWHKQFELIKRDPVLSEGITITGIPSDGGIQQTVCLPVKYLNGWLFKIPANRYKGERRETILHYQRECYDVLYRYWQGGGAINPRATQRQLDALTEQLRIMQRQLNEATATNRHLAAVESVFGPRVRYGSPSRRTGNPRLIPIRGHFRSAGRDKVTLSTRQLQLLLNLEG